MLVESPFYTKADACAVTRLARASIDRLEAAGQFPRRFNLTEYSAKNPGGKLTGKVVWRKTEVDEWCLARSRRILKAPSISQDGGRQPVPLQVGRAVRLS